MEKSPQKNPAAVARGIKAAATRSARIAAKASSSIPLTRTDASDNDDEDINQAGIVGDINEISSNIGQEEDGRATQDTIQPCTQSRRTLLEQQIEDARLAAKQEREIRAEEARRKQEREDQRLQVEMEVLRYSKRANNTGEEESNVQAGETLSDAQKTLVNLFPQYDPKQILAIANNTFAPENVQRLVEVASTPPIEEDELRLTASGTISKKHPISSIKNMTQKIWSRGFLNWLSIWFSFNSGQANSVVLSAIIRFHERIMHLGECYDWSTGVNSLAILQHRIALNSEPFTAKAWLMPQDRIVQYTAEQAERTKTHQPGRKSVSKSNTESTICLNWNKEKGCKWDSCRRRHVCSIENCEKNHPSFKHPSRNQSRQD